MFWALLKRDAYIEGVRLRKGSDGRPTEIPDSLRGKLPRDAVEVAGPNVRGAVPLQPQVIVEKGIAPGHPILADAARTQAAQLAAIEADAETVRLANLQRTADALKADAKKGK